MPKLTELAKEKSFYFVSSNKVLGYYKYLFNYDLIDFQTWLRKNAENSDDFLYNYFDKIILQYINNGIFQVFLTPYNIIARENEDDYYLNNGIVLQRGIEIYKDLKEIYNEDIGAFLSNKNKVKYFIYNFSKFAEDAKIIKDILNQKNSEIINKYIMEKEINIKVGNELILKHNKLSSKIDKN